MNFKETVYFLLALVTLPSCGILGIYNDNSYIYPEDQAILLAEIDARPISKKMDSLIMKIDSALLILPEDLSQTTLIVETYNYNEYLKISDNKFYTRKDSKKLRRFYKNYTKKKLSIIKKPKYKVVYLDKGEYESIDVDEYRYVLRTSIRLKYDPNNIYVDQVGNVYPWSAIRIYYIFDRQSQQVFKEIKDLKILSNGN